MGKAVTQHPALQGLTEKRRRFVIAYVQCGNASEAAREAGYAKAPEEGHRLLKNAQVQAAISALTAPKEERRIATTEQLHQRLSDIAMGIVDDIEPKGSDMVSAAKLLLTCRGELIKKHEHTHAQVGSREELIAKLEQTLTRLKGGK